MHKDMTFYSWMSATHMMNGYPSSYQLSKELLGNGSAGTRLDFPSHLEKFCSNTSCAFGDLYSLAKNSTVLPYYLAFRPASIFDSCVRLMASHSVESLKFILGLPPSRTNQFPILKLCPSCFELDIEGLGYGYWHRGHQLPSAHICTKHGELLHTFRLREEGRGKNELTLPSINNGVVIQTPMQSLALLQDLSNLSVRTMNGFLPGEFNPQQLQFTYQHGLKQHGLITPRGKIKVSEFLHRLEKYFQPIQSITPYDILLSQDKISHFLKLIRKPRGFHHPIAHLLLIQFLFNSWDLFCSTYKWESQFQLDLDPEPQLESTSLQSLFDDHLNEIAVRYKAGESLRKLALEYSYDIGTLMRQLEKHNLATIKKRPKKVSLEIKGHVLDLLSKGHDLNSISQKTSLSKSTIDRIFASNPSIHRIWKENKKANLRAPKRQKMMQFIADYPHTSKIIEIKKAMSYTYKWLTAHDSVWLNQFLNNIKPARVTRSLKASKPRINWSHRDDECLKALQEIKNIELESWERRKPQAFLRRLPALSFKPRLSNLPKSKAWITNALERLNESIG
jgi:hypothetical protein